MNGKYVLDTNTVIYHLRGLRPWAGFIKELRPSNIFVSVITRMELLAWDDLTAAGERQIRSLLDSLNITSLSDAIETEAISLRRKARLKLPDAIVAATAVVFEATLVTNDKAMACLNWPDLKVIIPT
jgi:predicted nucleic acid-binding protein